MFDEPDDRQAELSSKPALRAQEKSDEFRMHAELCAVFEGCRKFDAELRPDLTADQARDLQRTVGKLEKAKTPDSPILPDSAVADAARLLEMPESADLTTNDYHVHRRPGEVMIARWLAGDEVDQFYTRIQAHFDAALEGHKEDEQQATEWKGDAAASEYLKALGTIKVNLAERYLREPIRKLNLHVLSTQSADELNIAYLADYIMSVPVEEIVGEASAPPMDPTEQDLAWYFKLFSLRGMRDDQERMCYFAYLQKTDDWS
jgi:hypothetical protein